MVLLVAASAVVVHLNALPNPFAIDDVGIILQDQRVREFQAWRLVSENFWFQPRSDRLYRPLVLLSLAINWAVSHEPAAFRVVNLLLHAGAAALVTLLARSLFGCLRGAAAAGLVFALHPVHTEPLNVIVGRADLGAAVFLLMALVLHWEGGSLAISAGWRRAALVTLCFAAALGCKENAVVLPAMLLVLDWWRWRRARLRQPATAGREVGRHGSWRIRRAVNSYLPLAAVFLVYLGVRSAAIEALSRPAARITVLDNVLAHPEHGLGPGDSVLLARWATPAVTFAKAVRLTTFPGRFSHDYSYPALDTVKRLNDPRLPAAAGAILGLLVAVVGSARRTGRVAVAITLGVVAYSVTSNTVLLIGTIFADRLLYLPSLGFALAVGIVVTGLSASLRSAGNPLWRAVSAIGLLAVALSTAWFAYRTIERNRDWRSPRTLIDADEPVAGRSARWLANAAAQAFNERDFDVALDYSRRVLEVYPDYEFPWRIIGLVLHQRRQYDEALPALQHALALGASDRPEAVLATAEILVSRGDYRGAIDVLEKFVSAFPLSPTALNNLAWFLQIGEPAEVRDPARALRYAAEAWRQQPGTPAIADTYARALAANGQRSQALEIVEQGLQNAAPDDPLRPGLVSLKEELRAGGS